MSEENQMERNLARLLSQSGLAEPTNPFEKKLFDRHLHKSLVSTNQNKNPNSHSQEVTRIIAPLITLVDQVRRTAEHELESIHQTNITLKDKTHLCDRLLGQLQGSVEFILNKCQALEQNLKAKEELKGKKNCSIYESVLEEREKRLKKAKLRIY